MNESASSARGPAYSANLPETVQPSEGSSSSRTVSASRLIPLLGDDQPTVITQRAILPTDSQSDSVTRILHGQILPGERLGHFELLQYVGGGGMGKVFRALDTRLARSVALEDFVAGARGGSRNGVAIPERGPVGSPARSR